MNQTDDLFHQHEGHGHEGHLAATYQPIPLQYFDAGTLSDESLAEAIRRAVEYGYLERTGDQRALMFSVQGFLLCLALLPGLSPESLVHHATAILGDELAAQGRRFTLETLPPGAPPPFEISQPIAVNDRPWELARHDGVAEGWDFAARSGLLERGDDGAWRITALGVHTLAGLISAVSPSEVVQMAWFLHHGGADGS